MDPITNAGNTPPKPAPRILVVDDDTEITTMLRFSLHHAGYQVTTVNDSTEALQMFRDAPSSVDVIVSDCNMPNMTGVELSKEILAIRPDTPIIMASAQDELTAAELREIGIRGFVPKPYTLDEIASAVAKVLA